MINWYSFRPVDTLFFRGAEPMNRGEQHVASSIFPPYTSTINGAIRTTYLLQNGIAFDDYNSGSVDEKIHHEIGKSGKPPNFDTYGPLFYKNNSIYMPAPYTWYTCTSEIKSKEESVSKIEVTIRKGTRLENTNGILFTDDHLIWVKNPTSEIKSIGGYWIKTTDLDKSDGDRCQIFSLSDFACVEPRTGVALKSSRMVNTGHLYTFDHIRLHEDVSLVFGIEPGISLNDNGILKIGAEQRFGLYEKIEDVNLPRKQANGEFMVLGTTRINPELNKAVIATGKIIYIGGWDLAKGFHKPMCGFVPAGTVFNKKFINNVIEL